MIPLSHPQLSQWIHIQMNNTTQNKNEDRSPALGIPSKNYVGISL